MLENEPVGFVRGIPFAIISFLIASANAFAGLPDWARSGFQKADGESKFFVGISSPQTTEQAAIQDSRRNAILQLVQTEFASAATLSVRAVESTSAAAVLNETHLTIPNLNLNSFELVDQYVDPTDDEPQEFIARSLYRFSISKLAVEKERVAALPKSLSISKDRDVLNELAKVESDQELRRKKQLETRETWRLIYPAFSADVGIGVQNYAPMTLGALSLALRFKTFQSLYLGVEGRFGMGSKRLPDEVSNSDASSDFSMTAGPFFRFYPVATAHSGFYVKGQIAWDRLEPTCSKDNLGVCVRSADPTQRGVAAGGGIGVSFQTTEPKTKRTYGAAVECSYLQSFNQTIGRNLWLAITVSAPILQ